MPELHTNGNYDAYLAQLFNPATAGQFNSGMFGPGVGGYGGLGAGAIPNPAATQSPWATQNLSATNGLWPQQQGPNPAHSLAAIQIAQQIAARHALHAIQCAQALQQVAMQQWTQQPMGWQPQFGQFSQGPFGQGVSNLFGAGQFGQTPQLYGWAGQQNPLQQALQQQAMLQLAQQLAQQPGQFRYGMAA
jgi:hypothetical protein